MGNEIYISVTFQTYHPYYCIIERDHHKVGKKLSFVISSPENNNSNVFSRVLNGFSSIQSLSHVQLFVTP